MKRIFLIALAVLCISSGLSGQVLRHVPGLNLAGLQYGYTGHSNSFGIAYSRYSAKNWILNATGYYETGQMGSTKLKNYVAQGGIDRTLFKVQQLLYFNAGLSFLIGSEHLSSEETTDKKNSFLWGGSGNINVECYVMPRLVLQLKAEEFLSPGSNLGKWHPAYSAGLKYCF